MAQYPIFPRQGGSSSHLDITVATVVKATPGTLWNVTVTTAGSTVGGAYDANTTGGATAANLIGAITDVVGTPLFTPFPCLNGILIVPGTGQVVSVSYA